MLMRTDMSENCRRCDITSLPVNETYVVCSWKVNNWNNGSTYTITIWINLHCLDNSPSCKVLIWHLSSVNIAKIMFSGAPKNAEISPGGTCVHRFVIPAVNFRATDCVDLIDRQACNVTPTTVLRHISSHELLKMIQDDVPMDGRNFIKFPSHTQALERIVKLVTEDFRKRVEPQNRDGFIRATLESRKQISQFESKKDKVTKIAIL
ncbi:hypothetical protein AVEN_46484-1 [Araneus ventricosus]|uniref:Uncharacterized protein n=1 Tax=Araneus ventricosus TaxID=182803 RepID=A0A4Y2ESN7_ARAVE|nr:hypothetical protein AVEN_46484-1 [Araneus ventricosus]